MFDEIEQLILASDVAFPASGSGISHAEIAVLESELGMPLPPSFRWWLNAYGIGQVGSDIVYGSRLMGEGAPDIVEINQLHGMIGADDQKVIFCEGNDEYYYFDAASRSPQSGEMSVWVMDHETGSSWFATNFAEFLRIRLHDLTR